MRSVRPKLVVFEKICHDCHKLKLVSKYSKNINSPDGYQDICKLCIAKYNINNKERLLVTRYNVIDKKKNQICNLTKEWVKENITSKPCVYCGDTERIGCDRIDNSKGHIMDNVVPCCTGCNWIRRDDFSVEEMMEIGEVIKKIKYNRLIKNFKVA